MSRSHNNRRGKRTAGEILGHSCFKLVGDRVVAACGGERVGSPNAKRNAKLEATRKRRRASHALETNAAAL
jgi:hypothetical protein